MLSILNESKSIGDSTPIIQISDVKTFFLLPLIFKLCSLTIFIISSIVIIPAKVLILFYNHNNSCLSVEKRSGIFIFLDFDNFQEFFNLTIFYI